VFIVAGYGLTVMFSHAGPLLLFPDWITRTAQNENEIKSFPSDISSDEEQAEFVLGHIRVGRA
jgi:hypothetical protein